MYLEVPSRFLFEGKLNTGKFHGLRFEGLVSVLARDAT